MVVAPPVPTWTFRISGGKIDLMAELNQTTRRSKVVVTLASVGGFAMGAIAGPALADVYEWGRGILLGETVTETEIRRLTVVSYHGTLLDGYTIEETVQGSCSLSSIILQSPNAYRCTFESDHSYVADPCLAMDGGASVVCPTAPWERNLIQINLDEPVSFDPSYVASDQGMPWGLEVQDPRNPRETWRCRPYAGATSPLAGNQPNWWCVREDGTGAATALNDLITEDGRVWRILFDNGEEPELVEADVAVAWF